MTYGQLCLLECSTYMLSLLQHSGMMQLLLCTTATTAPSQVRLSAYSMAAVKLASAS